MRISRKLVSIAAASALVAGAGLATAAPASAATMKGSTTITIDTAVVVGGLGAGLGIYAGGPATSTLNSNNSLGLTLSAKQKSDPGSPITHKGAVVFTHGVKGKIVKCTNPSIAAGEETITISCVVTGLAAAFANFEGQNLPVMVLDNVKTNSKKGTTTGTVKLNPALPVESVLNASLETTIFTNGMTLGTAKVTLK